MDIRWFNPRSRRYLCTKRTLVKEQLEAMSRDELKETLYKIAKDNYDNREKLFGSEVMRDLERIIMLKVVDNKWMEHLDHMDMLREGISLRAYGQRNPLVEYKIEVMICSKQ